jgi:indole-3-glycerol phosphate synthase
LGNVLETIVRQKQAEIAEAKSRVSTKQLEQALVDAPSTRDFAGAFRSRGPVALIAEIKKASPSAGIIRPDFDPVTIARAYAEHGASCLSVLTDEHFFQGHLKFLRDVRQSVDLPLLRKDFILDEYQVLEARAAGADAVLLIAECLPETRLEQLHQAITSLGMQALIELYDASNLDRVLATAPALVGVNNRDLRTFVTDLHHSVRLRQKVPPDVLFVAESGIRTHADVELLRNSGVDAMLVGESLMRQPDVGAAVDRLLAR